MGLSEKVAPGRGLDVIAVNRWLTDEGVENPRSWLLILDNVTESTVGQLHSLLPMNNPRGNILFASRSKAGAHTLTSADGEQRYCEGLSSPRDLLQSASSLRHSAEMPGDIDLGNPERSVHITRHLGCLPLAIKHAAFFIKTLGFELEDLLLILDAENQIKVSDLVIGLHISDEDIVSRLQLPEGL